MWTQMEVIVEACWALMVQWTKAHTCEGTDAMMTAEPTHIALGNDVTDMFAKRGAEGGW